MLKRIVLFALVVLLHVVRSEVDPVIDGVSAYALTRYGYLYRVQVIATGLAALILTLALLASGLASAPEVALLALFGVSRIMIAGYPTDPRGTIVLSRHGRLHAILAAVTDYGGEVAAAVARGAVWAMQFHPEKSSDVGLQILGNWVAMASGARPKAKPEN